MDLNKNIIVLCYDSMTRVPLKREILFQANPWLNNANVELGIYNLTNLPTVHVITTWINTHYVIDLLSVPCP